MKLDMFANVFQTYISAHKTPLSEHVSGSVTPFKGSTCMWSAMVTVKAQQQDKYSAHLKASVEHIMREG